MKKAMMLAVVLFFAVAAVALAAPKATPSADNGLTKGASESYQLYLYEKDPTTWQIVEGGAWGKLNINDDKFVFNGKGLEVGEEYTLINYARVGSNWPAMIFCLGDGVANKGGNVNIMGEFQVTLLPDTTPGADYSGAKIWLVPTEDVICEENIMGVWHPEEYLFEYGLIPIEED